MSRRLGLAAESRNQSPVGVYTGLITDDCEVSMIISNKKIRINATYRTFFRCACDECGSDFIRRSDYRSFEVCLACSDKRGGKTRQVHGCNNRNSRLHVVWGNMKRRCLDPQNKKYPSYGGAGIGVCDEWIDFVPFKKWADENGYADHLTIDRINNEKGYSPNNCRFVSRSVQNANKRITDKNKSGYIGVSMNRIGRYVACVQWKGKQHHVGCFGTPEEAGKARDRFVINKNLPHSLNFPQMPRDGELLNG